MEKRIRIKEVEPAAYMAMYQFEKYLDSTPLKPGHRQLMQIRASQVNGCAYCIDVHTKKARVLGETEQRIYALNAWRDTPFFTDEERALLALTEEVTLIQHRVSDECYRQAVETLGESYTAQAIMAIIAINGWNRIVISTNLQPHG